MINRRLRNTRRKPPTPIADLLIAVGLIIALVPFVWLLKTSFLQRREVDVLRAVSARTRSPVSAPQSGTPRTTYMPPEVDQRSVIVVPKLHLNAVVVEEVTESDLDRGPMHLFGTGSPGFGNYCIAAHKEKWFRGLRRLSAGDTVTIRTGGFRYIYTITGQKIVPSDDLSVLEDGSTPTLTLITCSGPAYFGRGKGRVIVSGKLKEIK
jgi:sortase A